MKSVREGSNWVLENESVSISYDSNEKTITVRRKIKENTQILVSNQKKPLVISFRWDK